MSRQRSKTPDASSRIVDRHGRRLDYLRVSVTDRCNLHCTYCRPAAEFTRVKHDQVLRFEEIARLVRIFASMGVYKIRLTGGEPLLRRNLSTLVRMLRAIPGIRSLPMTTNGLLLNRYGRELKDAGLGRLNVSLDTLREKRFQRVTRFPRDSQGVAAVLAGIRAAQEAGFQDIKLNAVLIRGFNDDEVLDFIELGHRMSLHIRFIEFMPFGGTPWDPSRFISYQEVLERVQARFSVTALPRRNPSDPAIVFRIPGKSGTLGFIASVSESFCRTCSRLRLTAEGKLLPCLHADAALDLRTPLREGAADTTLKALILEGAQLKPKEHPDFLGHGTNAQGRRMIQIGG